MNRRNEHLTSPENGVDSIAQKSSPRPALYIGSMATALVLLVAFAAVQHHRPALGLVLCVAAAAVLTIPVILSLSSQNATFSNSLLAKKPSSLSVLTIGFAGLVLTYAPSEAEYLKVLHHVGIGFIVAAAVSWIWQIQEMREFFLDQSSAVMMELEYLKRLNDVELRRLREKSIQALIWRNTTNPRYEIRNFTTWLDGILVSDLLPTDRRFDGRYRKGFEEHVDIRFMSLGAVLDELVITDHDLSSSQLDAPMFKQTSSTRYEVVSPNLDTAKYCVRLAGWASDVPAIPPTHRVQFWVGFGDDELEEVTMDNKNVHPGGTSYVGSREGAILDGVCRVRTKSIEYRSAISESWIMSRMNTLTHGIHIAVNVSDPSDVLEFEGEIIGVRGPDLPRKDHREGGYSLGYDGWLLPDHGYFLWWWRRVG